MCSQTNFRPVDSEALDASRIPRLDGDSGITEIESKELPQSAAQSQKNQALIQLLRSWREGDEQEQRSTWEYLKQALDEDRLSERKLFP